MLVRCPVVVSRVSTALLLAGVAALAMASAHAASVTVMVTDAAGAPLPDAVVYAEAAGSQALPKALKAVEIQQKGRRFLPLVSVVQAGTEISFPNNDTVRHHVYSFSTPKVFELKLYSGTPGSPVLFDKPGTVVVGCNIHDQMLAYIQIVNTPYFAHTDAAGRAQIEGVAAGKYALKMWYYKTPAATQIMEQVLTVAATDVQAAFRQSAKPAAGAN
jgi:plastocyanin